MQIFLSSNKEKNPIFAPISMHVPLLNISFFKTSISLKLDRCLYADNSIDGLS